MALTYSQMKLAMQEALEVFSQASKRKAQGILLIKQAQADTNGIMTRWSGDIADLQARATAEPDNAAIQALNAEVQQMLADYSTFKVETDSLVASLPVE